MTNLYELDNVFGKLSIDDLNKFEEKINYRLPVSYRNYLLNFNGSKPLNTICHVSETEGNTTLHTMFGIHNGPESARLEPSFGDSNSIKTTGLLAFADDTFGNYFCIHLSNKYYGKVYFYDHESSCANKVKTLTKVADDFDDFINMLVSESDYDRRLAETDPEFYKRLQYAKNNPQL